MNKTLNILRFLLLSIIFFLSSFLTSNALDNNQLSISVEKDGSNLNIVETWNALSTGDSFERTIPISDDDISNISIERIFPTNKVINFKTNYNQRDNTTTLTSPSEEGNNKVCVVKIKYRLNLDKSTSEEFLNAIPNSLFENNAPTISNIKVSLNSDGKEEVSYYNQSNMSVQEFTQETSKSQTMEVIILLLKISVGIIAILIFCIVVYAFSLRIYYRNIQKNRGTKFKINKLNPKKIKHKKAIKITKNF